jgi:hypothetical protein
MRISRGCRRKTPTADAVHLYQGYVARIPFVDEPAT